jgi:hypothetical protein
MPDSGEMDWCWCGNRVVARCVDCRTAVCERHRLQDGAPPPDLVHYQRNGDLTWPYQWEAAWAEAQVETGWLGASLAEQLFHAAYADRSDLALCRTCRAAAGIELIATWRAISPPMDGWDRALWLMSQGFEPARVAGSVPVGTPRVALTRFLAFVREQGIAPTDRLTLAWRTDGKGRNVSLADAEGWKVARAGEPATADGPPRDLFVSGAGEAYVFTSEHDLSGGRLLNQRSVRGVEHKRLPDDRWQPGLLAAHAFLLTGARAV